MIKDQRHMTGPEHRATPEAVKQYWAQLPAARLGHGHSAWPTAPRRGPEPHESNATVHAYISDSRWVAECLGGPTGECKGGMACWPDHPKACCLDCGTIYRVEFPHAAELEQAVDTLTSRPQQHRHWKPWEQSAASLAAENIAHGFAPAGERDWRDEFAAKHGIDRSLVDEILTRADRDAH